MRSRDIDIVNGSLPRGILQFAFPLAATGILQQLFNSADLAVVGTFVGNAAMAAVGCNSPVISLILNLFIGTSLGTTVVIATALGRGDTERVRKAVHTSITAAVLCGILMTFLCEALSSGIIRLLSVPDDVFDMALLYLRVYLTGLPVVILYNFEAAIFRSEGNTRTPLTALVISGVINVLLNIFFVVSLGMTVDGVAWATVISNAVSALYLLIALMRTNTPVRLRFTELGVDRAVLGRILRIGIPSGVQGIVFSVANITLQTAVNSLGTVVMAGSSAAYNVEIIAYYVLNSFGQACTTFVSQNNGAGNRQRCHSSLAWCLGLGAVFTALTCALLLAYGHQIFALFNSDPEVISTAFLRMEIIFFAYCFSLPQEVFSGYLRGYGISTLPAACAAVGICGTRVAWVFTVFQKSHTFRTIVLSYPVSLFITAVAVILVTIFFERKHRGEQTIGR